MMLFIIINAAAQPYVNKIIIVMPNIIIYTAAQPYVKIGCLV